MIETRRRLLRIWTSPKFKEVIHFGILLVLFISPPAPLKPPQSHHVIRIVNFAFFQTDVQGNIWGTDSWADPNVLFGPYNWNPAEGSKEYCSWDSPTERACSHHNYEQGLIHLVHTAGAEIYPSIGGWTLSDAFPAMAASETARATFAQNCVTLILDYGFDGN